MKLYTLSAQQLAEQLRNGNLTSLEIVEAYIERIEKHNKNVNAVVVPLFLQAREEARVLDEMAKKGKFKGPLHGIPVTIKESIEVNETPTTWGIEGREKEIGTRDDYSVERLREAGAIILGKTNAMQLLMGCETVNPIYGRTNNPWNVERTSGGSSGGEGAAIASLFSPIGIGTDIGGSVRTPAHFCGIHSLKPTPGTIPQYPPNNLGHIKKEAAMMSSIGPLAKTADDLKMAYEVLSHRKIDHVPLHGLTAGIWMEDGILATSPSIRRAVNEAAADLEKLGVNVVQYDLPSIKEAMQCFYGMMCADGGVGIIAALGSSKQEKAVANVIRIQGFGKIKRKMITALLKGLGQKIVVEVILPYVGTKSDKAFSDLVKWRETYREFVQNDMKKKGIDFIVSPVFPVPALLHDGSDQLSYEGAYNSLINFLGFASGALSFSTVKEGEEIQLRNLKDRVNQTAMKNEENTMGLPLAVQIASFPYQEDIVLSVMKELETASKTRYDYPVNQVLQGLLEKSY
ncbi:MAG: amidase family protein [Bacillota bacterium]|nr:amidase family protein [Bacillota bacterium]